MTTSKKPSFQEIILRLQQYWSDKGCALLQPYDMEVGAGTSAAGPGRYTSGTGG